MTACAFHEIEDVRCVLDLATDDHRCEDLLRGDPRRVGPLIRIAGDFAARDLTPTFGTVAVFNSYKNYSSLIRAAEARFKKLDERQIYLSKLY
jgi:hypothetical protein